MKTKLLAFFGIGVGNFFFSFLFLFPLGLFAGEYSFTYKFEEPVAKELANGLYLIELKDTKQNDAVIGAPLLPVKQAKIFIPAEDKVTAVKVEPLELTAMEGAYTIQHATTPYPTSYQGVIVADKPDHKIYSSDSNYPAVSYQERGSQYLHGEQIVQVDISPVVYNPAQRQVDYYKQITVTVQTKDQGRPAGVLPARNLSTDIKAILTSIDNKEDYLSQHSASTEKKSTDITASSGNAKAAKPLVTRDYVVITTSAMTSAFTALANHRQSAAGGSFTTYIKDIANIRTSYTGVDDAEKIRKFIIDMYINYGTQFIVLGGDCDGAHGSQAISTRGTYAAVGSYTENYIPSDLYYGCLDGTWNNNGNTLWGESDDGVGGGDIDWASEVYVGRIPADTSTEATTQINKIIAYETGTHPNNTLLIGEKLDSTPTWGGDKVDWVYGFMNSMPKTELYDRDHGTNDWPRADLLSQINSNAHNWLNHLGHGNPYWNMKLANADVASMTNNKYFFHYTQACTSGSIDGRWPNGSYGADSILEDLVNSNNYGAFATIGNSRYGWYNSGTYVQGASNLVHKEFVEAIFSDGDTTLGEANQKSKTQLDLSQGIYRWIAFETNLLGDPVTEVTKGGSGGEVPELIDDFASPSTSTIGLAYDPSRNGVWIASEDGNIYMIDAVHHTIVRTISLVGLVMAGDGNTDGVEVLGSGNLLLADFQGDLSAIDDYIFEFDPDTETMVNYWPLDGASNTSTDGTNIDQVVGVAKGSNGHIYVTSFADNNIYEIALVNGSPGTWRTVSVSPAPVVGNALGIDGVNAAGFAISDSGSTTVGIVDSSSNVISQFAYQHNGNSFNSGVTILPGNPDQLWVTDYLTNTIGVFALPKDSIPKRVNMSPIYYLLLN